MCGLIVHSFQQVLGLHKWQTSFVQQWAVCRLTVLCNVAMKWHLDQVIEWILWSFCIQDMGSSVLTGQPRAQIRVPPSDILSSVPALPNTVPFTHDLIWTCCWLGDPGAGSHAVVQLCSDECVHCRGKFAYQRKCRLQLRVDSLSVPLTICNCNSLVK